MDEMEKTMLRLRLGHLREAIRGNLLQLEYETGLTPRPDEFVVDDPEFEGPIVGLDGQTKEQRKAFAQGFVELRSGLGYIPLTYARTKKFKEETTTPAPTPGPRYAVGQWVEILEAGCVTPIPIEGFIVGVAYAPWNLEPAE